jgi:hypothetical protein
MRLLRVMTWRMMDEITMTDIQVIKPATDNNEEPNQRQIRKTVTVPEITGMNQ